MRNRKFPTLLEVYGLLREQDDLFGDAGDDAGDDKADDSGDDDAGDEDSGDTDSSDDSGNDDSGSDEDESDKGDDEEEKDPKIKITAEDEARLADSIDEELDSLFVEFETDARKAAAINSKRFATEGRVRSLRSVLFESAADDIDLRKFAAETARLVKNYDTLMDIKSIILNKALSYIKVKYGDDTAKSLADVLEQDFRLSVAKPAGTEDDEVPEAPIAVGARTPSA